MRDALRKAAPYRTRPALHRARRHREGGALADAQHHAHEKQREESAGESRQDGRARPDQATDEERPPWTEAIADPPAEHLKQQIWIGERGEDKAKLKIIQPELVALGIALGIGVGAALLIGVLFWRRKRLRTTSWSSQLADLNRRCLVALDDVLASGSLVTGHVQALAAEAQSLEDRAPDDLSRTAAARLRARLEDLARTLEADRSLRLASPPPSSEQISYSTALIRQQADQLHGVLRVPRPGESPA